MIGGGSGISNILQGLKQYTSELTAIVTMFDSGGSSGLLRKEFGYPPFGDLRRCLLALGEEASDTEALRRALEFRFGEETSLNGHSVGNLLLAALTTLNNDLEWAIEQTQRVLRVAGRVVPVTLEKAELCAELDDGRVILGESHIDLRLEPVPRIKRIFLDAPVSANPRAIAAILDADAIVLGPGDLYTSILPNLLVNGIVQAVAASRAVRIYICNLMTKRGETDQFKASDFVREVLSYLGPARLDWAIINTSAPPRPIQQAYEREGASLVEADLRSVNRYVNCILAASLATSSQPVRHDNLRTAEAVLRVVTAGQVLNGHQVLSMSC